MLNANTSKKIIMTSLLALSLGACSMFSGQESGGQYADDTAITTKVKTAFIGDPLVKSSQISVETMQGVVQLSGFTNSPKSEARAVELAREVDGVKSVKDNVVVQ